MTTISRFSHYDLSLIHIYVVSDGPEAPHDILRLRGVHAVTRYITNEVPVSYTHLDVYKRQVDYMDVSTQQVVSVGASLIPFLEHDDAKMCIRDRCAAYRA